MHGRYVRMVQASEGQSFPAKPLLSSLVGEGWGRQNLDGDVAVELLIMRAIDDSQASSVDFFLDPVVRQPLPNDLGLKRQLQDNSLARAKRALLAPTPADTGTPV